MLKDKEKWTLGKKLKVIPPFVSIVLVMVIMLAFQDVGILGVSILFALLVSFTPYTLHGYFKNKRVSALEEQFPNFLRDLAESKKSGMTLPQAIKNASENEYGKLTSEIKRMNNQISLGVSFEEVLEKFEERMEDSKLITRSVSIILNAQRSGGDVVSTMETIASNAATIKELERERQSKMRQHSMVMYLIYFMFLGITVILSNVLIRMTQIEDLS
ncbi:MAG: type II secretion system F family protein, partial [Candidatus Aenigmatarchaeota archaeon]